MKAIQAADRGGYDALRLVDIPQPQPRAGQALVRVTSAGGRTAGTGSELEATSP
jgi:NADPH:quinone reductase-like Zn-dependent oxidoreductase